MEAHWQPAGYTVPNAVTYPFRWLWDSCFHALIWAELGEPDRAIAELRHVFSSQRDDGFVAHIDYAHDPTRHATFWGRDGASTITQPPMAGHAVAELERRGIAVPDDVVTAAARHIAFFLRHRRHRSGLISVVHPWETGCDDSPRFDQWGAADPARWYDVKGELVAALPDNGFDCAPVSISALVVWNGRELGMEDDGLEELSGALRARWMPEADTWVDAGAGETSSGRARTLDGLLPLLVDPRPDAFAALAELGAPYGPRGVHPDEPTYDPRRYWRGPVWPQLAYLVWRAGGDVATQTVRGAITSELAEYWDPDDGTGLGAVPQSWSGLMILMDGHAGD
jgi:hypothetical protein